MDHMTNSPFLMPLEIGEQMEQMLTRISLPKTGINRKWLTAISKDLDTLTMMISEVSRLNGCTTEDLITTFFANISGSGLAVWALRDQLLGLQELLKDLEDGIREFGNKTVEKLVEISENSSDTFEGDSGMFIWNRTQEIYKWDNQCLKLLGTNDTELNLDGYYSLMKSEDEMQFRQEINKFRTFNSIQHIHCHKYSGIFLRWEATQRIIDGDLYWVGSITDISQEYVTLPSTRYTFSDQLPEANFARLN